MKHENKTAGAPADETVAELRKVIGGKSIAITFKPTDGAHEDSPPITDTLFIKALSVRMADQIILVIDDEFGMAKIFTGKDDAFLDTLTASSFNDIVEEGQKVNADFFDYCSKRIIRRAELQRKVNPRGVAREAELLEFAKSQIVLKVSAAANLLPGSAPALPQ
jgi:hypothetical protein